MWQNDTVTLLTPTETNVMGSISISWANGDSVTCDVQDINREYVYKNYGFEEYTEYKQIFDHTRASWVNGRQVSYDGARWLVRLVNDFSDMGSSNHKYVIISKVIE